MNAITAYIALGANLGDAQMTLSTALVELARLPKTTLIAQSSLYRSPPFGEKADGPDYINAVARISTALSAHALLEQLQQLEQKYGRERHYRNAPRTLDLDILLYDDAVFNDVQLTVPHPRMHERAFVLLPLNEIYPDLAWRCADGQTQVLTQLLPNIMSQKINRIVKNNVLLLKE